MSRAATFTQAEIVRALKAAKSVYGDNGVAGVEITSDGRLRVLIGTPVNAADLAGEGGDWDEVLAA